MTRRPPSRTAAIVDYDPSWPADFEQIRVALQPALDDCDACIEHVGSTAVPGLAAKPVIDVDVVEGSAADVPRVILALRRLIASARTPSGTPRRVLADLSACSVAMTT